MVFIIVLSATSFKMMYKKPGLVYLIVGAIIFFFLLSVFQARERRKNDPEPTWYTYNAFMVGLALVGGLAFGHDIFTEDSLPYFMVKDLKVIGHLDASKEHGQNVLDAGIIYFAEGNKIDSSKSWHFKQGAVYCVAPIIKGDSVPETQSFDFWAVGKDCCSVSTSDFRCGDFKNPNARSAIRVLDAADRPFYRLAVKQAETAYGIMATHPVFFQWAQDPLETVNSWNARAFIRFVMFVTFGFLISLSGVACASCKFSWIGRAESVYSMDIKGNDDWQHGGAANARDLRTRQV
jgi:hypothetical protein